MVPLADLLPDVAVLVITEAFSEWIFEYCAAVVIVSLVPRRVISLPTISFDNSPGRSVPVLLSGSSSSEEEVVQLAGNFD